MPTGGPPTGVRDCFSVLVGAVIIVAVSITAYLTEQTLDGYSLLASVGGPFLISLWLGYRNGRRGFGYGYLLVGLALALAGAALVLWDREWSSWILLAAPLSLTTSAFGVLLGMGAWELISGRRSPVP